MEIKIRLQSDHFKLYEKEESKKAALAIVPMEMLKQRVETRMAKCNETTSMTPDIKETVRYDMLFSELMTWFKRDFFKWMDSPNCPKCQFKTVLVSHGHPTSEEAFSSAHRVELFTCKNCFTDNRVVCRFPRYNDPVKLLTTRVGRCGEWANCFCLIARACGFEVRYILDFTDHVWLEVYTKSLARNRWMHADPCENSLDNPLVYEGGWSKKLSYVMAFSQDDIQDVTWRYTHPNNLKRVLSRRKMCTEYWLVKTILRYRKFLQAGLSDQRRAELQKRLISELVEFMTPRDYKGTELMGRQSGSFAWRLSRQELGIDPLDKMEGFIWMIPEANLSKGRFCLVYDCVQDSYLFDVSNDLRNLKNWHSGVHISKNFTRKEEHDWNMVYLSRTEGSSSSKSGNLCWKFDCKEPNKHKVLEVLFSVSIDIFSFDANVTIEFVYGAPQNHLVLLNTNTFHGQFKWKWKNEENKLCWPFLFNCKLEGGDENIGWQQAQICRQSMITASPAFKIEVVFEK